MGGRGRGISTCVRVAASRGDDVRLLGNRPTGGESCGKGGRGAYLSLDGP